MYLFGIHNGIHFWNTELLSIASHAENIKLGLIYLKQKIWNHFNCN